MKGLTQCILVTVGWLLTACNLGFEQTAIPTSSEDMDVAVSGDLAEELSEPDLVDDSAAELVDSDLEAFEVDLASEVDGLVACSPNEVRCDGLCTDLQSDALHCGACDNPCGGGECLQGECWCAASNAQCPQLGEHHTSAVCTDGLGCTLQCTAGFGDCNGAPADSCEVDLSNDSSHCGVCGNVCFGGSCGDGWCSLERVSVNSTGGEANGASTGGSVSADGRFVSFTSSATNLVLADLNGIADAFVRDRQSRNTERVSVDSQGSEANDTGATTSVSNDGRFVAFDSKATNLVLGDTNASWDVFVRDRQDYKTTRVSITSSGAQADGGSFLEAISGDGRFVVFYSFATNLSIEPLTDTGIFVHDQQTGATTLVGTGSGADISADGRFVAFASFGTNLVQGDTNGQRDVFLHEAQAGRTTRLSVASDGTEGNGASFAPTISDDGRWVSFCSDASNLVSDDTNGVTDLFVYDREARTLIRASVDSSGAQADGSSFGGISSSGRLVTFFSNATNLVVGDTNGTQDVFAHDLVSGATLRVSLNAQGEEMVGGGNGGGTYGAADRHSTFASPATNLVGGDTNGVSDVFIVGVPL